MRIARGPLLFSFVFSLLSVSILAAGREAALAQREHVSAAAACGSVSAPARGGRYRVDVLRGSLGCRRARAVIRYVLTHGRPTQGYPGRSPRGWRCAWGYGRDREGNGARVGPNCTRGSVTVQGSQPGFAPYPNTSSAAYRSCGQIQIKTGYRVPLSVDRLSCSAGAQVARGWIRRLSAVGNRTVVNVGRYRCVWRVRTTNLVTCSSGARRARFSALD